MAADIMSGIQPVAGQTQGKVTRRERVRRAFAHQTTDIVPYHLEYTPEIRPALCAALKTDDLAAATGDHFCRFSTRFRWSETSPGFFRDDFGVVWNRSVDRDSGVPQSILSEPDLSRIQWPDPWRPDRIAAARAFVEENHAAGRFTTLGVSHSLFERAWALRGMDQLLIDMLESPQFVDGLLDRITEHQLAMMEGLSQLPWDGVWIGDDWGQQHGLIMGKALWRRFIMPRARQMYDLAHRKGWVVIIHTCGDVVELLPDLIEAGVQVLNPFQPEVMDLAAVKRQYGRDLAFLGGMSVQRTLPHGTPQQVREEARWLLREIGPGGGFVFAPSHTMTIDVPVKNVLAMLEVIRDGQGESPAGAPAPRAS